MVHWAVLSTVQYCTIQCSTVMCSAAMHSAVPHCTVQCGTTLCRAAAHSAVWRLLWCLSPAAHYKGADTTRQPPAREAPNLSLERGRSCFRGPTPPQGPISPTQGPNSPKQGPNSPNGMYWVGWKLSNTQKPVLPGAGCSWQNCRPLSLCRGGWTGRAIQSRGVEILYS